VSCVRRSPFGYFQPRRLEIDSDHLPAAGKVTATIIDNAAACRGHLIADGDRKRGRASVRERTAS